MIAADNMMALFLMLPPPRIWPTGLMLTTLYPVTF
jgi:hypothetical protein